MTGIQNPNLTNDPRRSLKRVVLAFKLSALKKTHIWTPFNVYIPLNDAFLFRNKENKMLFAPPPKKKRRRDMNGHEHGYTHM